MSEWIEDRFARTALLLGREHMDALQRAHITVAGLGAVGSFAVEALARAGVGRLTLLDFDTISESNINRQLFALNSTLNRPKTAVAVERVQDINPDCLVEGRHLFINSETVGELVQSYSDSLFVDAIDSLNAKVDLLATLKQHDVPVISSMGAATRMNPHDIRVADLADTHTCPLARLIRKRLRRRGVDGSHIRCIFSKELRKVEALGDPAPLSQQAGPGRRRRVMGSISYMTGLFGLMAAHECIAHITGGSS